VRSDSRQVGLGDAEPTAERHRVLIGRHARNDAAAADVVAAVQCEARITTERATPAHRLADDDLHATPRVIGAVAVRGQGAAEVRLSERGDGLRDAELGGGRIKRRETSADVPEQARLVVVLIVVAIEPACGHEKDLPLHREPVADGDQSCDGLELLA
jgi:hypothetical protein